MQFSGGDGPSKTISDPSYCPRLAHRVVFGSLIIDRTARTAAIGPLHVLLSPAEIATLCLLIKRHDTPMPREAISEALSGGSPEIPPRMVDVHVCRLRRKLALLGHGSVITTVWGRGYLAVTPPRDDIGPGAPVDGGSIAALLTA